MAVMHFGMEHSLTQAKGQNEVEEYVSRSERILWCCTVLPANRTYGLCSRTPFFASLGLVGTWQTSITKAHV